ncbi:ParB/RepB/Spo0J family partition protein [Paraburkholderia fungorum]|uniref:ParB/RepB/Spo0J family partition protein n=1 Tax=Paraburkholderia fungorum TaxID=134537 RepID=UPI0020A7A3C3|nr:ParB/RepB/Spo0J family partition protein [Paraburkholderia fungorum]
MGIADHLRKKVGDVKADTPAPSSPSPEKRQGPKTAVGENMIYAGHLHSAQQRIKDLERQLTAATALDVDLALLVEVEGRRRKLTDEQFLELKSNLEKHPLTTPILVRALSNGTYEIVAGHNRVTAYRELGRKTIRANVTDVQEGEIELAAFFSNLLSPSLSDFEKYWNFVRLQTATNISRSEIAEASGLSVSHTHRIFAYDTLPPAAKTWLEKRPERLGSTAAQKLAKATDLGHGDKVVEAVRKLVEDASFTQDQAVAMLHAKPPRTEQPEKLVVKVGKKKVCEVATRNGVVGIRFADAALADRYATEIHEFLQQRLQQTSE